MSTEVKLAFFLQGSYNSRVRFQTHEEENMQKENELATRPVGRLLWSLALPSITAQVVNVLYNMVDRMYIGHIPGEGAQALTGLGVTMPVILLISAFSALTSMGGAPRASIMMGRGKKEEAERILGNCCMALIWIALILTAAIQLFGRKAMLLFGASEATIGYAWEYLSIYSIGTIAVQISLGLNMFITAQGLSRISMCTVLIGAVCNIILDPIFIFVFRLGIAGAAIATVISQATLTVYVVYAFLKRPDFMIHLRLRRRNKNSRLLRSIIKMGMPSFYVQLLATAVNLVINFYLLTYGSDKDIAAVTIMASIFSFYHMIVFGIVQGNNAICGYNWGAKEYERVRKSLKLSLFYAFLLSTLLFILIEFFPHLLVNLFTEEVALQTLAANGIKLYLAMLPLVGLQTISSQYFQAVGKATQSSVLSFLRYGVFIVPAILLLAPRMGVQGIYLSNACSDGLASMIAILCIVVELKRLKGLAQVK